MEVPMQNYIGKQIDRYRIIERLGMGGMAVVYKAYDTRLERDVALKLIRVDEIPPSQHERLMKRFEREAKAMARFSHPNIVPVYDYGEVDGTPYLVMEFVPGGTLKERISTPAPYQQAIRWLIPIADALRYAHERNVFHRDVKPSNILFDSEDRPLLTDFGIAKVLETDEATLTGTGLGVGTPEYMAPEQWQGHTSETTDQYALGVVLYEVITGRKPYSADTPAAIILMQATEPLQAPSGLVQGIPDTVEKVLYKALAHNPHDRHEDMNAFAKVLSGLLAEAETVEPVTPRQTPQPVEPSPDAAANAGSEDVTRDTLDATPSEGIPQQTVSTKKKVFPKWIGWVFGGVVGLILITLVINLGKKSANTPITINPHDGAEMISIPAGKFLMGSEGADAYTDEAPEHTVYLGSYWIYKYEVTNDQYRMCIEDGKCTGDLNNYPENEYPAVYITWYEASDYCEWAGGRLPTEAEWEKAARGVNGITYPWGETVPNCNLAQYNGCSGQLMTIGSFPDGASPYGVMDMAGNAWEWVADWYEADYYHNSSLQNPTGPVSGSYRVLRGGSWIYSDSHLRSSDRSGNGPFYSDDYYGFRCVSTETP